MRAPPSILPLLFGPCLLLGFACQSPPPKAGDLDPAATTKPSPGAPEQPAELTCVAEPLARELTSYCDFDLGVPAFALAKVGFTAEPYHPLATRVITLTRAGLTDPEGAGTVSVQAWLADPPRRIPEPGEMVLAVAADVPITTVAELQRGLSAAGRKEVRYLVHVTDERPLPQPRDPAMLASMRDALPANSNERVMFVAKAIQGYAETCPPVASVFPQLNQVAAGDRCTKLGELAAKAIVECGCADLGKIMTLLYAVTIGFDAPLGRAAIVPVFIDPAQKLTPAPGATWGEVAAAEFDDADLRRLWFDAVAPPAEAAGPG